MVDMGPDPVTGDDLSHSVRPPTISPTQYIAGFTHRQIDDLLFPRHPDRDHEKLVACSTPRGWLYFQSVPGEMGNFREFGEYNRFIAAKLRKIDGAVDIEYIEAPNGVRRVKSWKPKGS